MGWNGRDVENKKEKDGEMNLSAAYLSFLFHWRNIKMIKEWDSIVVALKMNRVDTNSIDVDGVSLNRS